MPFRRYLSDEETLYARKEKKTPVQELICSILYKNFNTRLLQQLQAEPSFRLLTSHLLTRQSRLFSTFKMNRVCLSRCFASLTYEQRTALRQ